MNKLTEYINLIRKHQDMPEDRIADLETNMKPSEISDKDLVEERNLICNKCDRKKFQMCLECLCLIPLKIRLRFTKCPIGKWSAA